MSKKTKFAWISASALVIGTMIAIGTSMLPPSQAVAGNFCTLKCNADFGQCMADTGDRATCSAQRNICLNQCIGG